MEGFSEIWQRISDMTPSLDNPFGFSNGAIMAFLILLLFLTLRFFYIFFDVKNFGKDP